jgi:hypothetical protein
MFAICEVQDGGCESGIERVSVHTERKETRNAPGWLVETAFTARLSRSRW